MNNFDITASERVLQYWSSSTANGTAVEGLVAGSNASDMIFGSDNVTNHAPIAATTKNSIAVGGTVGAVGFADPIKDFQISMLVKPSYGDAWLIRYEDQGVRFNADGTLTLVWVDNVTLEPVTVAMPYTEEISYLVFSVSGPQVSVLLNGRSISITGVEYDIETLTFGDTGAIAPVSIEAIAMIETEGNLPRSGEYSKLFNNQRLDVVPRPDGHSSFTYLADVALPEETYLTNEQFQFIEDYFYAAVNNPYETGLFSIEKRTAFQVEYSVDYGDTWTVMPARLYLDSVYPQIMFRHSNETDTDYSITVRNTYDGTLSMASFGAVLEGQYYLNAFSGSGYYDFDTCSLTKATLTLSNIDSIQISSIELLGEFNDVSTEFWLPGSTSDYTLYVNGEARALNTIMPNENYHIIVVFDTPQDEVKINPSAYMDMGIAGVGASDQKYTASDAAAIFNVFAGNVMFRPQENIYKIIDGVLVNSPDGNSAMVYDLQWNG